MITIHTRIIRLKCASIVNEQYIRKVPQPIFTCTCCIMNCLSTLFRNAGAQLEVFEIQYGFFIYFFHDLDHSFTQNHFPKKLFQILSHQLVCAALTVRVTVSASLTAPSALTAITS